MEIPFELPEPHEVESWGQRKELGGLQLLVNFPNGYGASVIKGFGSYGYEAGLWELAVIHADQICYRTPITDDVVGRQSVEEISELLKQIAALPEEKHVSHKRE